MKIEYFASPEIKALAQHSGQLGWYSEVDWECFLRTGVVFGHRLQSNEIVSSAYFANFENKVGWLGAVIVNSRFQGKKLGRDLIQKVLSIAPDDNDFVLALIATERGKRMYEQAGFIEIGNTHKYVASIHENTIAEAHAGVRTFTEADTPIVLSLDSDAVGYNRHKLLRERLRSARSGYVHENQNGEIDGFIISNADGERMSLGPVVAPDLETALSLVHTVIARGGSYRLDIPHWQADFIKALGPIGFELERICPLLTYKGRPLLRASDSYFTIMAQALG